MCCFRQRLTKLFYNGIFTHQVSDQMNAQTSPSSTIIIVLTDGKLDIYPYELSVQEVSHVHKDTLCC